MTIRTRAAAVLLALAVVVSACGDDDDGVDAAGAETTTTAAADETTTTTAVAAAISGPDATAVAAAVATVFDTTLSFDDKVALVEGGEAHRADHDNYAVGAAAVGGIAVEPTAVVVDGDAATVTYRVLFAGTEAYTDLTMDVARIDGAWVVPTDAFCGSLASARTPCEA